MAEAALHRAAPRPRPNVPPAEGPPLRPWLAAGQTLAAWLESLEDDPPPGEDSVPMIAPHAKAMGHAANAFVLHFRGQRVEVGADLPIVFTLPDECGVPHRGRLSPDVVVALGVRHNAARREYDVDLHGAPDFALEVLSRTTWQRDVDAKLKTYAAVGVRECFLFDPTGSFPVPTLQGFALTKRTTKRLPEETLPDGRTAVRSCVLGLAACVARRRSVGALSLRWHDPETGQDLRTPAEEVDARLAAERERDELKRQQDELKRQQDDMKRHLAELEAQLRQARERD